MKLFKSSNECANIVIMTSLNFYYFLFLSKFIFWFWIERHVSSNWTSAICVVQKKCFLQTFFLSSELKCERSENRMSRQMITTWEELEKNGVKREIQAHPRKSWLRWPCPHHQPATNNRTNSLRRISRSITHLTLYCHVRKITTATVRVDMLL